MPAATNRHHRYSIKGGTRCRVQGGERLEFYRSFAHGADGWELIASYTDYGKWPSASDNPWSLDQLLAAGKAANDDNLFGPWTLASALFLRTDYGTVAFRDLAIHSIIPPSAHSTMLYDFEGTGTQGWTDTGGMITRLKTSSAHAFHGKQSLEIDVASDGSPDQRQAYVLKPPLPAGTHIVRFRVWIPPYIGVASISAFVQQGAPDWNWYSTWRRTSDLVPGAFNTIDVELPENVTLPVYRLGIELDSGTAWRGAIDVDAVKAISW